MSRDEGLRAAEKKMASVGAEAHTERLRENLPMRERHDTTGPEPGKGKIGAEREKLPSQAMFILRVLTDMSRKEGYCWAKQSYLARELGMSVGTLYRWLEILKKAGRIKVDRWPYNNRYTVLDDPVRSSSGDLDRSSSGDLDRSSSGDLDRSSSGDLDRSSSGDLESCSLKSIELKRTAAEQEIQNAAAAAESPSDEKTMCELIALGLPSSVRTIVASDPGLGRAVLSHCESRFKNRQLKPVQNKAGYIVRCLREPERVGFVRDAEGGWTEPTDDNRERSRSESARRADEHARREAERIRAGKQMAIEAAKIKRWDGLPEATKERIRRLVRTRLTLFAGNGEERFRTLFDMSCRNLLEEMERDGQL